MAQLVISKTFMERFGKLERAVQTKVRKMIEMFDVAETTSALNIEKINGAVDGRARTARVDKFWRAVVAAPTVGESAYILIDVLPHDDAIDWVKRHRFNVNQLNGALEVIEVALGETDAVAAIVPDVGGMFDHVSEGEFSHLGISEEHLPIVRRVADEDQALALASLLPTAQADVLVDLATGATVEDAYRSYVAVADVADAECLVEAAAAEASSADFLVVADTDELQEMLFEPFEHWKRFLHPAQRRFADREYSGPAKITGGAGTGKTVVALHRARYLMVASDGDILLTTFTRNLANDLEAQFRALAGESDQVEVRNIDRISHQVVAEAEGMRPRFISDAALRKLAEEVVGETALDAYPPGFLVAEWEDVILAQDITTRAEYFQARRAGRGVRLGRRERAAVWSGIELLTSRLAGRGERTFVQLANDAARYMADREPPYGHVIVDEAQDLHPAQWRLLRALVAAGPNDLFITGDAHQRIYDHRVSLSSLGIETRGRSRQLRINYRTTAEILQIALAILSGEVFDDLDDGLERQLGYRSALTGEAPVLKGHDSFADEVRATAKRIVEWSDEGIELHAVAIAARDHARLDRIEELLAEEGIDSMEVKTGDSRGRTSPGVRLATMHRLKGLEFQAVAVVDVSGDSVPSPYAVADKTFDPVQHDRDLQREKCLLYVACTRARDRLSVSWNGEPSEFLPI